MIQNVCKEFNFKFRNSYTIINCIPIYIIYHGKVNMKRSLKEREGEREKERKEISESKNNNNNNQEI